jgi:uncharacterized protein (DUF3084 family)
VILRFSIVRLLDDVLYEDRGQKQITRIQFISAHRQSMQNPIDRSAHSAEKTFEVGRLKRIYYADATLDT